MFVAYLWRVWYLPILYEDVKRFCHVGIYEYELSKSGFSSQSPACSCICRCFLCFKDMSVVETVGRIRFDWKTTEGRNVELALHCPHVTSYVTEDINDSARNGRRLFHRLP